MNPLHSSLRQLLRLLSDVQLFDDRAVTLDIGLLQVVQKVSSVTNHLQKSAAAVVVLVVGLEVLGQIVNSVGQNCDLYLGRTRVTLVRRVGFNNCLLFVFQHSFHLSAISAFKNSSPTQSSVGDLLRSSHDPKTEQTTCVVIISHKILFVKSFLKFCQKRFKNIHIVIDKQPVFIYNKFIRGALAQLGAHNTGSVGVRGSNPLCSTKRSKRRTQVRLLFLLF